MDMLISISKRQRFISSIRDTFDYRLSRFVKKGFIAASYSKFRTIGDVLYDFREGKFDKF